MVQRISDFFIDATKTFMYFCTYPLQWLFLFAPRVYETIITIIVFTKNNVPTVRDLRYTLLHWQLNLLRVVYVLFFYTIKILILFCKFTQRQIQTNLDRISIIIKSY